MLDDATEINSDTPIGDSSIGKLNQIHNTIQSKFSFVESLN